MNAPTWRRRIAPDHSSGLGVTIRPTYRWDDRVGAVIEIRVGRYIVTRSSTKARS